jgi:hypothetical protein
MLNENLRVVLKSLIGLNNTFVIQSPKTVFADEHGSIMVSIDTEALGEELEEPIYVHNMSELLGAIELVPDAEIEKDGRVLKISNADTTINYITSDPSIFKEYKYSVIETTKKVDTVGEFEIDKELLSKLKKSLSIFSNLNNVKIVGNKNGIVINMVDNSFASGNSVEFKISGKVNKDFEIIVPAETLLKLPATTYKAEVKYNENRDAYRLYLSNTIMEAVVNTVA